MGHVHPEVNNAVANAIICGAGFSLPTLIETQMANLVCEIVPSIEKVRMVSSGTEATMSAGYKTLQLLGQPGVYDELEQKSVRMEEGLRQNAEMTGVPLKINRVGSMLCPYFTKREVINFETAQQANNI